MLIWECSVPASFFQLISDNFKIESRTFLLAILDTHLHISTSHVLDGMPFGVIQVDATGKAVYANHAVYVLTGMDKQLDIVGRHYLEFPWDQFDEHEYPLDPSGHVLHQVLE